VWCSYHPVEKATAMKPKQPVQGTRKEQQKQQSTCEAATIWQVQHVGPYSWRK